VHNNGAPLTLTASKVMLDEVNPANSVRVKSVDVTAASIVGGAGSCTLPGRFAGLHDGKLSLTTDGRYILLGCRAAPANSSVAGSNIVTVRVHATGAVKQMLSLGGSYTINNAAGAAGSMNDLSYGPAMDQNFVYVGVTSADPKQGIGVVYVENTAPSTSIDFIPDVRDVKVYTYQGQPQLYGLGTKPAEGIAGVFTIGTGYDPRRRPDSLEETFLAGFDKPDDARNPYQFEWQDDKTIWITDLRDSRYNLYKWQFDGDHWQEIESYTLNSAQQLPWLAGRWQGDTFMLYVSGPYALYAFNTKTGTNSLVSRPDANSEYRGVVSAPYDVALVVPSVSAAPTATASAPPTPTRTATPSRTPFNSPTASPMMQAVGSTNVLVVRVGDGYTPGNLPPTTANTTHGGWIDEYTLAGLLVRSFRLPNITSGTTSRCSLSGGVYTMDGFAARSPDNSAVTLACLDYPAGGTQGGSWPASSVPRVVASLTADGVITTTTKITDSFASCIPRAALSPDGTNFIVSAAAFSYDPTVSVPTIDATCGVRTVLAGAGASSKVDTNVPYVMALAVFGGVLYGSVPAHRSTVGYVGIVSYGQATTSMRADPTPFLPLEQVSQITGAPGAVTAFTVASATVVYLLDYRVGLAPALMLFAYTQSASVWTETGAWGAPDGSTLLSLADRWEAGVYTLYATSTDVTIPSSLWRMQPSIGAWKMIAQAASNQRVFRAVVMPPVSAVALVPTPSPSPTASPSVLPNAFQVADLVVMRVGDGSNSLSPTAAAPVFLDVYDTVGGALSWTVTLPTMGNVPPASASYPCLSFGNATSPSGVVADGHLTLSKDRTTLTWACYGSNVLASAPRVIASLSAQAYLDTTSVTGETASVPSGAVVDTSGWTMWTWGSAPVRVQAPLSSFYSTVIGPTATIIKSMRVLGSGLVAVASTNGGASWGIARFGSGMPTTASTLTWLPGLAPGAWAFDDVYVENATALWTLFANATYSTAQSFVLTGGKWVPGVGMRLNSNRRFLHITGRYEGSHYIVYAADVAWVVRANMTSRMLAMVAQAAPYTMLKGVSTPPASAAFGAAVPTASGTTTPSTTPTNTPTASLTATVTSSATRTPTSTSSVTMTATQTSTQTSSKTGTSSNTPTQTPSQTRTPSNSPSKSGTPSRTATNTASPSRTPSGTPSKSRTAAQTPSSSNSPSRTASVTGTSSKTPTPSRTAVGTPSGTGTPTRTPTFTPTPSKTGTGTGTSAVTPTRTATPSKTPSVTRTGTQTPTVTSTSTGTPSKSGTPSNTPSQTSTQTQTPSISFSVTATMTPTQTASSTFAAPIFASGSLMLLSVGNGTANSVGTQPVWVHEFDLRAQAVVNTVRFPIAAEKPGTLQMYPCTAPIASPWEPTLTLSGDGRLLTVGCFGVPLGLGTSATSACTNTTACPRVVGAVLVDGSTDTSTRVLDGAAASYFRGVWAWDRSSGYWYSSMYGSSLTAEGLWYIPLRGTTSVPIDTTVSPTAVHYVNNRFVVSTRVGAAGYMGAGPLGLDTYYYAGTPSGAPVSSASGTPDLWYDTVSMAGTPVGASDFVYATANDVWVTEVRAGTTATLFRYTRAGAAAPWNEVVAVAMPNSWAAYSLAGRWEGADWVLYLPTWNAALGSALYRYVATTGVFKIIQWSNNPSQLFKAVAWAPVGGIAMSPSATPSVSISASALHASFQGGAVVVQVGPTTALTTTASAVRLVEVNPATLAEVTILSLPTVASGDQLPCTLPGTPVLQPEGLLTRSGDLRYLTLACYGAPVGTAITAATPRVMATIDVAGVIVTSTVALPLPVSSPRGAVVIPVSNTSQSDGVVVYSGQGSSLQATPWTVSHSGFILTSAAATAVHVQPGGALFYATTNAPGGIGVLTSVNTPASPNDFVSGMPSSLLPGFDVAGDMVRVIYDFHFQPDSETGDYNQLWLVDWRDVTNAIQLYYWVIDESGTWSEANSFTVVAGSQLWGIDGGYSNAGAYVLYVTTTAALLEFNTETWTTRILNTAPGGYFVRGVALTPVDAMRAEATTKTATRTPTASRTASATSSPASTATASRNPAISQSSTISPSRTASITSSATATASVSPSVMQPLMNANSLLVVRVTAGVGTFVDEYSPSGTLIRSIPLPAVARTAVGATAACVLVANDTGIGDGKLALSADGTFATLACYNRNGAVDGSAPQLASAAAVARSVARINVDASVVTTSILTDGFSVARMPAAVAIDRGSGYWAGGAIADANAANNPAAVGLRWVGAVANTSVSVCSSDFLGVGSINSLKWYNGTLYGAVVRPSMTGIVSFGDLVYAPLPTTPDDLSPTPVITMELLVRTGSAPTPQDFEWETLGRIWIADPRAGAVGTLWRYDWSTLAANWVESTVYYSTPDGCQPSALAATGAGATYTLYITTQCAGASGGASAVWAFRPLYASFTALVPPTPAASGIAYRGIVVAPVNLALPTRTATNSPSPSITSSASATATASTVPQLFRAGNVLAVRVGVAAPLTAPVSTLQPVTMVELSYNAPGSVVSSYSLPDGSSGSGCLLPGIAAVAGEGQLTLGSRGNFLTLVCYTAGGGTGVVAGASPASAANRTALTYTATGAASTTYSWAAGATSPLSAVYDPATGYVFAAGTGTNLLYLTGRGQKALASSTFPSYAHVVAYNGSLYATQRSVVGLSSLVQVGAGTAGAPVTLPDCCFSGYASAILPGMAEAILPARTMWGFVFESSTRLWVADSRDSSTANVYLWTADAATGVWTEQYGLQLAMNWDVMYVAGAVPAGTKDFVLYASIPYAVLAVNTTSGEVRTVAIAPQGTQFRGLAMAPTDPTFIQPTSSRTASSTRTLSASATRTPTGTGTATSTQTKTQSATSSKTPTNTATPSRSATKTRSPSRTPTKTRTPTTSSTKSASTTKSLSNTASNTPTPSTTSTKSKSGTPTSTLSLSSSVTATSSRTPSGTPSNSRTPSITASPSVTPTRTPTPSKTSTQTSTQTKTPSLTGTPSRTPTGTGTRTGTPSRTRTPLPSGASRSPSITATPSVTPTMTRTSTGTASVSGTSTGTSTYTGTPSNTASVSGTSTGTPSFTASTSMTATQTRSNTVTVTQTPTVTPTNTRTPSGTQTVQLWGTDSLLVLRLGSGAAVDTQFSLGTLGKTVYLDEIQPTTGGVVRSLAINCTLPTGTVGDGVLSYAADASHVAFGCYGGLNDGTANPHLVGGNVVPRVVAIVAGNGQVDITTRASGLPAGLLRSVAVPIAGTVRAVLSISPANGVGSGIYTVPMGASTTWLSVTSFLGPAAGYGQLAWVSGSLAFIGGGGGMYGTGVTQFTSAANTAPGEQCSFTGKLVLDAVPLSGYQYPSPSGFYQESTTRYWVADTRAGTTAVIFRYDYRMPMAQWAEMGSWASPCGLPTYALAGRLEGSATILYFTTYALTTGTRLYRLDTSTMSFRLLRYVNGAALYKSVTFAPYKTWFSSPTPSNTPSPSTSATPATFWNNTVVVLRTGVPGAAAAANAAQLYLDEVDVASGSRINSRALPQASCALYGAAPLADSEGQLYTDSTRSRLALACYSGTTLGTAVTSAHPRVAAILYPSGKMDFLNMNTTTMRLRGAVVEGSSVWVYGDDAGPLWKQTGSAAVSLRALGNVTSVASMGAFDGRVYASVADAAAAPFSVAALGVGLQEIGNNPVPLPGFIAAGVAPRAIVGWVWQTSSILWVADTRSPAAQVYRWLRNAGTGVWAETDAVYVSDLVPIAGLRAVTGITGVPRGGDFIVYVTTPLALYSVAASNLAVTVVFAAEAGVLLRGVALPPVDPGRAQPSPSLSPSQSVTPTRSPSPSSTRVGTASNTVKPLGVAVFWNSTLNVLRVAGTGVSGTAVAGYVDQIDTRTGAVVNTTSVTGCVFSPAVGARDHQLSLSADGRFLLVPCYFGSLGTTPWMTRWDLAPRVVARISVDGTVAVGTKFNFTGTAAASTLIGSYATSVASLDGTAFYLSTAPVTAGTAASAVVLYGTFAVNNVNPQTVYAPASPFTFAVGGVQATAAGGVAVSSLDGTWNGLLSLGSSIAPATATTSPQLALGGVPTAGSAVLLRSWTYQNASRLWALDNGRLGTAASIFLYAATGTAWVEALALGAADGALATGLTGRAEPLLAGRFALYVTTWDTVQGYSRVLRYDTALDDWYILYSVPMSTAGGVFKSVMLAPYAGNAQPAATATPSPVPTPTARAYQFTPGNLLVLRVGTGTTLPAGLAPLYLDEVNVATGATVSTMSVPTTCGLPGAAMWLPGEGALSLSLDGRTATFACYNGAQGAVGVTAQLLAFVDADAVADVSTRLYPGANVTATLSADGSAAWVGYQGKAGAGLRLHVRGMAPEAAVNVSATYRTVRALAAYNRAVYAVVGAVGTTPNALAALAPAAATGPDTTLTILPGMDVGVTPARVPSGAVFQNATVVWVADPRSPTTASAWRWTRTGGVWAETAAAYFAPYPIYYLTGGWSGRHFILFGTAAGAGATAVYVYNTTDGAAYMLATAPRGMAYRGIAFVPSNANFLPLSVTSTGTPTSSWTPSRTRTPTGTPSNSASATGTPTQTASRSAAVSNSVTATKTPSVTPTRSASGTKTPSNTPSKTSTPSKTASKGSSKSPTGTASVTPTASTTSTLTGSPTAAQTASQSPPITASQTQTASGSLTLTPTRTVTQSTSPSNTASRSGTQSGTPSFTQSSTATLTPYVPLLVAGNLLALRSCDISASVPGATAVTSVCIDQLTRVGTTSGKVLNTFSAPVDSTMCTLGAQYMDDGHMALAADNRTVTFGCYGVAIGTATPWSTSSPRMAAVLHIDGSFETSAVPASAFVSQPLRAVAAADSASGYVLSGGSTSATDGLVWMARGAPATVTTIAVAPVDNYALQYVDGVLHAVSRTPTLVGIRRYGAAYAAVNSVGATSSWVLPLESIVTAGATPPGPQPRTFHMHPTRTRLWTLDARALVSGEALFLYTLNAYGSAWVETGKWAPPDGRPAYGLAGTASAAGYMLYVSTASVTGGGIYLFNTATATFQTAPWMKLPSINTPYKSLVWVPEDPTAPSRAPTPLGTPSATPRQQALGAGNVVLLRAGNTTTLTSTPTALAVLEMNVDTGGIVREVAVPRFCGWPSNRTVDNAGLGGLSLSNDSRVAVFACWNTSGPGATGPALGTPNDKYAVVFDGSAYFPTTWLLGDRSNATIKAIATWDGYEFWSAPSSNASAGGVNLRSWPDTVTPVTTSITNGSTEYYRYLAFYREQLYGSTVNQPPNGIAVVGDGAPTDVTVSALLPGMETGPLRTPWGFTFQDPATLWVADSRVTGRHLYQWTATAGVWAEVAGYEVAGAQLVTGVVGTVTPSRGGYVLYAQSPAGVFVFDPRVKRAALVFATPVGSLLGIALAPQELDRTAATPSTTYTALPSTTRTAAATTSVTPTVSLSLISPSDSASTTSTPLTPLYGSDSVVVVRVGNGITALSAAATAVFLDEIDIGTGVLRRSTSLPTVVTGTSRRCTLPGGSFGDGQLMLSPTGGSLTLACYDAPTGAVVPATASAAPRVVARIGSDLKIDTRTAISDAYLTSAVRTAVTPDDTTFFVGGDGGIRKTTLGAGNTTATLQVLNASVPVNALQLSRDTLFMAAVLDMYTPPYTSYTGVFQVGAVGGLPVYPDAPITPILPLSAMTITGLSPAPGGFCWENTTRMWLVDNRIGTTARLFRYDLDLGLQLWVETGAFSPPNGLNLAGFTCRSEPLRLADIAMYMTTYSPALGSTLYRVDGSVPDSWAPYFTTSNKKQFKGVALPPLRQPTPTATASSTQTPSNTASNSVTPSNTASPSKTETPSATPSETPSQTATETPSSSVTPSETSSQTATETNTPSHTPSPSPTATNTPSSSTTPSNTPSYSPTMSPTESNTASPSNTPSDSPTGSPSQSSSASNTAKPSQTPSVSGSSDVTPTPTLIPSALATGTPSPTVTPSNTPSQTTTATVTRTRTITATNTRSVSGTGTSTRTGTPTPSSSSSAALPSRSMTGTATATRSRTPTRSPSRTGTISRTGTPSVTKSGSGTPLPTGSGTPSQSPSTSVTVTGTAAQTAAVTSSPSTTGTGTRTSTRSATGTASVTATAPITRSVTTTALRTASVTGTLTATPSPTSTPSTTATWGGSPTGTGSGTATSSPSVSGTRSSTSTATRSTSPSRSPMSASPSASTTATSSGTSSASRSPSSSPSGTASLTRTPTPSQSVSVTVTATARPTGSGTAAPTTSASGTRTPSRSATLSATVTRTPTVSRSGTRSVTTTRSATPSKSRSQTGTPTRSGPASGVATGAPTGASTPTASVTGMQSRSGTRSVTPSITGTPAVTPTGSASVTVTRSGTASSSRSSLPTATATITASSTRSNTATISGTVSGTGATTPSATPSGSSSATVTRTPSRSGTLTSTKTPSASSSSSSSKSQTQTPSASATGTSTPSASRSAYATPSASASPSVTASRTVSPSVTPSNSGSATVTQVSAASTPTRTPSGTASNTGTPSFTASTSVTPSITSSASGSPSVTPSNTASRSASVSGTLTCTGTVSPSSALTASTSPTPSRTVTVTGTLTSTGTPTTSRSAAVTATPTVSGTGDVTATTTPLSRSATPTPSNMTSPSPSQSAAETPSVSATLSAAGTPSLATRTASLTASSSMSPAGTPTATPSPSASVSASVTVTNTPSRSPTPSRSAAETPSGSPSPSKSATVTGTTSRTATGSVTQTASASNTASPSVTPSRTASETSSASVTAAGTPSGTPSALVTPSVSPSVTAAGTPAGTQPRTATATVSALPSDDVTPSVTATVTATPSQTSSQTPSSSVTPSFTPTPSQTRSGTTSVTPTRSGTVSRTPSNTAGLSPSVTGSGTRSRTGTRSPTPTRTITGTNTRTRSATATGTASSAPTVSSTATVTVTRTGTAAATVSGTATRSATGTLTGTGSVSATVSATGTSTQTGTGTQTQTGTGTATQSITTTSSPSASTTTSNTPSRTRTNTGSSSVTASNSATSSRTASATGTPTRSPTVTATNTGTPSGTPSNTASGSVTGSQSRSPAGTPSATPSPPLTGTVTGTATRSGTPTVSASLTTTPSKTSSRSPTASGTGTFSPTTSNTPSLTRTASDVPTVSPTVTVTPTRTGTVTATVSGTGDPTSTRSPTPSGTPSLTAEGTGTNTGTPTFTRTGTRSATGTVTMTGTASETASITATPSSSTSSTATGTGTQSGTSTPTGTGSGTQTPTGTPSTTQSLSASSSRTVSDTATATDTRTGTATGSGSATASVTPMETATGTASETSTQTPTRSNTITPTAAGTTASTVTPSSSAAETRTPTRSATGTASNTASASGTVTGTAAVTPTPTSSPSVTATTSFIPPSDSASVTQTASPSGTSTRTQTQTPSNTATVTQTYSWSVTATPSPSSSQSGSITATPSVTTTGTGTASMSITATVTRTATNTGTATRSGTMTATGTDTPSSTSTGAETPSGTRTPAQTPTASLSLGASPTRTPAATAAPPTPSVTNWRSASSTRSIV